MIIFQKVFCDYVIYSTLDNTCIKLNYENESEKGFYFESVPFLFV